MVWYIMTCYSTLQYVIIRYDMTMHGVDLHGSRSEDVAGYHDTLYEARSDVAGLHCMFDVDHTSTRAEGLECGKLRGKESPKNRI